MSLKHGIKVIDDTPRYAYFNVSSPSNMIANNTAPGCFRISLPYQVKPNGNILAAELLKADVHYSPILPPTVAALPANAGLALFQRVIFDARANVPDLNNDGISIANPIEDPVRFSDPLQYTSTLGISERCFATWPSADVTGSGVRAPFQQMTKDTVYFGCNGVNPIVPSGGFHVWSHIIVANSIAESGDTTNNWYASSATGNSATLPVIQATVAIRQDTDPDGSNPTSTVFPFVRGRLWYRLVELTPYQHLMICKKYNDQATNQTPVRTYGEWTQTNVGVNQWQAVRNDIAPAPVLSDTPGVWFGS